MWVLAIVTIPVSVGPFYSNCGHLQFFGQNRVDNILAISLPIEGESRHDEIRFFLKYVHAYSVAQTRPLADFRRLPISFSKHVLSNQRKLRSKSSVHLA